MAAANNAFERAEHIEQQIRELAAGEFSELRDWALKQDWKAWDKPIEADTRSGKLEYLVAEVQSDYAAGRPSLASARNRRAIATWNRPSCHPWT
jgi:hypothetical protein